MSNEIESIGLGMDTSGVERGIKALDVLAGKGAPVEKAMAGIEGAADRTGKSLKSLGEGAAKGIDDLAKRAPAAASGLKKVDENADSAAKSVKSLGGAGVAGLDALNKAATVASTGMRSISTASLAADKGIRSLSAAANEVTAAIRAEAAALTGLQSGVAALSAANAAAAKSAQELAISLQAASEQCAKVKKATGASAEAFVGLGGAAKYAGAALAAIGIGTTVGDLVKMADASTNVASRLSLVTTSAAELAQVQRRLFDIAQSSRVSFVDLAGTYAQIARSTKELGVSQSSLLGIIKTVSQAVTISGGSAQSAQAALVQLSQGFAAGALRGEELNSVMEQTPRLAQAIADGLGIGIGKLREMGQAGELTAEKVLGALEKSAAKVEAEFGKMAVTVEQASTQAANSVLRLVGAFDKLSGATSFISGFITKLSQGIDFLSKDVEKLGSQGPLRDAAREVINLDAAAHRLRTGMQSGVLGPNAQAELDRINVRLEEAKRRFNELNAATGGTNPRDQTGFPTRTQSYAAEANRLAAVQAAMGKVINGLSGVKDDFYKDLNSLYAGYKNGLIGLTDYQKQVAKLIKDSGTAKPDAGANAALNDSLAAQLQAYKNNDKAILDSRKAFYDAQALLVKLGGKSELDAIDESLAKEEEVWAQRKANFEAELAQAAKKKTSQAEVARITGQMQDAERDYEQNIAKLRAESALADAKSLDAMEARIAGQEKASRAAMEQVRMAELEGKAIGLTGDALRVFNQQQLESSIPLALKMQAAWADQAGALGDLGRAARDQIQAMRDLAKAQGENRAAQMVYEYTKGIEDSNRLLQAEIGLMGMSDQARTTALEQLRIQLDLEQKIAFVKANVADTDKQAADIAKLQASASIAKANAANKAFLDEWKTSVGKYDDIFRQGFSDMLNNGKDGWKSFTKSLATTFKTTVADQLYKAFAQPFVVNIVGNLLGLTGSLGLSAASGAAAAASGGSALSGLGTLASGASLIAGNFGAGLTTGFSGLMAGNLGSTLGLGTGLIGSGATAGGIGTIVGALGPIALGVGALAAIANATKGETRTGGQFGVAFDGSVTNQRRGQTYTIEGQQFDRDFTNGLQTALKDGIAYRLEGDPVAQESAIREAVAGTASGINGFLKALGSAATLTGFSAGLETSGKGRGGVFAGGLLSTGAAFGESGKGDNYAGTLYEKFSTNSPDFKQALTDFTLDLKQSTIQALQSVTDIPQAVQKLLKGVDAEGLADDAANKLLETINAQIVGVNSLRDAFKAMGLDGLAALGFDAAAGLAEVSGGFDKLLGNLNTYYSNFFSADEQRANMQRQLQQAFAGLNLTLPDINADDARAQFRAIVEGAQQDLSESGQKTYATLLSLSGAFAGVTKELDGAATAVESISDAARNLKTDIAGLEIDLLRAKGDTTGANAAQRALDTTGLSAADVALYDYKQALIDQINTLNAASQAIADQTETRRGFERQLLELSGDTAALRLLDIQGMDAANVALYDRVQALQAEQAAEQAAADAAAQQASTRAGFERQLLELSGDTAALRLLDIQGMDAANVALYDRVQALQAEQAAEQAAAAAAAQQASTRAGLERQLLELQGDTAALRLLDIAGMDAANVALYDRIQALTASQAAEQAAADKAKQVAQERYGIETSMLQLQGNTAALRARELALLDPANRADQLRLYLLQDAQEAAKTAADAERELAATRVQSAQDAYRAAQETTGSAFDALSRSVNAERSLYESARAAAADAAQEIKSVIDTLSGSIQDLYAGVDSTRQASAAEGSAFIARALQAARTTGYLPDSKGLSDAITQARGGLGSQNYATQFEADRAQLVMAGQLSELSDIAKPQLTAAERTLRNAENQLKTLDDILKNAQSQVDAVRGISTTVGTISDALFGLQAALLTEAQAKAQAQATTPPPATAPTTPTTSTGGALSGPYAAQITDAIKAAAYTTDDRLVYDTARMLGVTSSELDKLMGWTAGTSLDWAKRNNLPAFAKGTNYVPQDMVATIHKGEAIVPKAFNPWAAGGQGMGGGNAEVVAELRALRQQNERLESRLASIEGSNNTMVNLLDDVTDGGNAMRSEVMA